MKKRLTKLLLLAVMMVVGVVNANAIVAYTAEDLTAAGWTKITSISQSDIGNNFYIFLSENEDLMLGLADSQVQGTKSAFYQDLADPATDATKVWMLEKNGSNYAMRNLSYTDLQLQTEWSGSNNDLRWRTNDQPNSISWTGLGITAISEGKFTLTSTQYNRPLGIYNNVTGTPVAGNEIGANDADNGQNFQIYAISKSMLAPLANVAYYLYNVETGLFLSRGAAYGTAAWADNFGIPVKLIANEGGYRLQWIDQRDQYVSDNAWSWADGGTNRAQTYTLSVVEDGYKLVNKAHGESNLTLYVNSSSDGGQFTHQIASNGSYQIGGENIGNTWRFITEAERDEIIAQKKAQAEADIATARGYTLSGTQTLKALVEDANQFASVDKTSSVNNAALTHNYDGWTYTKKNNGGNPGGQNGNGIEVFQGCGTFSQTVTELPNGIYKVTISGYYRDGSNAICTENSNKGFIVSNAYLEANGNQTMIADWASDRTSDTDPNGPAAGKTLFDAGKYLNEVYALVTDGSLTISIAQPGGATTNRWFLFTNVTLTYYNDQVSDEDANTIIQTATELLEEKMSATAANDLGNALNNFNADKSTPNYNALNTAITDANTSVANYSEAKDILDAAKELDEAVQNAYAADETVAAIQAAYNNGTLEAVTAEQKTACETALNAAFLATLTNVTDFTQQKYLLKNIASGKYLGAGNNWGTQASLVANAEYNILIPKGEGVYNIDTQVSSGGDSHFFNGSYMDNGNPLDINICKKPSGEYLLLTDSQVFGYDGESTVLASNVALTSENALWEIVSVEDAIADFANATEQNRKDATFLIEDHNFGRNNRNSSAWSHGNHTNFTYSGTNGSNGADYVNNVGESWHSKFYLEQKLENIPNGIYRLYAQGFYEEGADNSSLPYFFANNETLTFTKKTGGENSRKTAGASFLERKYINGPIEVTVIDGNLTIGAKNDQNESIWVAWDNFTLEFVSPLATATSIEELAATQGQVILNINGLEVLDNNETGEIVAQSLDGTPTGIVLKETGNINGASSAEYGKTINAMLLGTYNADLHAFTIEEHVSNKITVSGTSSTINNMDIAKATEKDQAYLLVKIENATIAEKQGVFYATSGNDEIKIDKRLDPTIKVNDGDLAYEITGVTFLDGDVCVLAPLSKNAIVDNKAEATEGDAYDQGDNVTEVEGTIMTFGGDDEEGAKYEFEGITPEVNGFASKTAGIGKLPVDAEGKSYDKALKNVPTQGTYYKFVPTKDGQLAVTVGLEKGKTLIVTEDGEAIKEEKQAADLNGDVAFPVEATKTYYVFATDADLAYYGFNFTPTDVNADNTAKDIATFKLLPEAEAGKADKLMLNDAVVTYIKGDNVFVEDASGAIDFYQTQIQFYVGQKLNGYIEGCNTTIDNMPVLQRVDGKTKYTTFKVTEKGTPEATAISPADAVEQDNLARFTKLEYVELQNDRQGFRVFADPQTGESVRVEDHFNVFYELGDLMEKVEGIVGIDREGTFIFWPTSKDGVVMSDGYKKATETELDVTNKTVAGKKDNPVEGISITLASACNAGSGSSMAGAMTSKGYKLRTANGSPVKESATFTVNQGKKVYDMTINGIANYAIKDDGDTEAAAIKVTKVEVDGKEVSFEGGEFPAKGASDCGTLTLKDINATKQIVLYFDNSNAKGTQVNIAWSVNYGEKVFTSKELSLLEEAKELAKDRDAIAVGCLDDAIEAAEAGDTEGLAETVAKFKAANADTEADATDKVKTDGWKKFDGSAAGVCATQYAPAITTYDGRTAQLAECYEGNADGINRTGTIIYQDITGLTNGTYKVAFYSNAFYTSGRGFDSPMSDGATDVAYVYANDKKEFISARIATETDKNSERQFTVQVTDGTIKLGLGKEKAGTNWHTIQIGQLTWFTTAREAFDAEKAKLQAAIDEAEGLLNNEQGGNKANLQAAVDEANASMVSNRKYIEDITEDVKKLQEAIAAFHEIGTVYVKHVATGMYLAAGKSWGTQAVLNETGLDLKFDYVKSSGKFNIDTQISNGGNSHYLGSNGYCDAAAFGWTVTQLSNGNYTIGNGSQYLCSTDNEIVVVGDNADEWQFVNAEELEKTRLAEGLASLQKATKDNGVDATFLIKDANFNRNDLRWSVWNVSEDCTNKNLGGGCDGSNSNGCAESYHSTFTISQVVANAPAGTYTLTAQGFYRQDDGETEDIPYIFANDEKVNIGEKTGDENSMTNASYSFDNGLYALETITVVVAEDGTLTVGVKGTATHQWVIWDNFQLTYYGNGGTPTAISEIETEPVRFEDGAIYNLRGVKVEGTLKPGLYIKNGKKIVIK